MFRNQARITLASWPTWQLTLMPQMLVFFSFYLSRYRTCLKPALSNLVSVNVSWSANEDNNVNLNLLALLWWRRKTLSGYWDLKAGRSWLFSGVYHSRLQKCELLMFPNFLHTWVSYERFKNVHPWRHYGMQEDFLRIQPRDNYDSAIIHRNHPFSRIWTSGFFFSSTRDVCTQKV